MSDWKQEIRRRLAPLKLVPTREAEIVDELAQHLEDRQTELIAGGASFEEAFHKVLAELSDREQLVRELRRVEHAVAREPAVFREGRKNVISDLSQDLRYALRVLRKSPIFTGIAIVTLALGIGANTAIFSLINSVLLRPLPIANPQQLIALNNESGDHSFPAFSYPNYKDLRDRNDVFSSLIGYRVAPLSLSHDGINERVWGFQVTGNYFDALGVSPALGRLISPDDDRAPGESPVAVVSYKGWQQRFGGDESVVGRDVIVNGRRFTIIGVAPRGFFGTEVIAAPDLWFPISMQAQLESGRDWLNERDVENIFVQGRLKPDVKLARAQAQVSELARQLEEEFPNDNEGKRITLASPGLFSSTIRGAVFGFSGLLMAIVGLVLLLACVNLANLTMARAAQRRREIAVRLALGASRFRLVRQLLTESVLLAAAGGALGLVLALRFVEVVAAFKLPIDIPAAMNIEIDYRVFVFTLLISLATGVLFGLLPAWQATKADLVAALKEESSSGGHRGSWLKSSLIVSQIALSLVLLIGGALMLRALAHAQTINLGFTPERAAEVSFDLRLQGYDNDRGREFQKRLLERVRVLPGVQAAAIADMAPVDLHFSRSSVFIEGQTPERLAKTPMTMINRASPGYFETIGTRLVQGRDFNEQDDERVSAVAIVNETFARRFFPGEDPIGKRFSNGSSDSPLRQIIGVVQDGKYSSFNEEPQPFVSRPLWQSYSGSTVVLVRTEADPKQLIAQVRNEVAKLDSNIPVAGRTLVERMSLPLLPARFAASLLVGFGLLALALAAIGIYGVMSFSVSKRIHEIGIRMALGAQNSDVLKLVLGQGLKLTLLGIVLGVLAAIVLTRFMAALLFGVSATDPLSFLAVAVLLLGVAMLACYVPARRALKIDPMSALRCE